MASRFVRSVFWLSSFTALGYGLLVLTTPSESYIQKLRKDLPGGENNTKDVLSKNQQFANVLQTASGTNKPFYRLSKKEIENELEK